MGDIVWNYNNKSIDLDFKGLGVCFYCVSSIYRKLLWGNEATRESLDAYYTYPVLQLWECGHMMVRGQK